MVIDARTGSKKLPLVAECSLDQDAFAGQLHRWKTLADRYLTDCHRQFEQLTLTYEAADELRTELETLVKIEATCCPSLAWVITYEEAAITLKIRGNHSLLDELHSVIAGLNAA